MSYSIYTDGSFHQNDYSSGYGVYCAENRLLCACGTRDNVLNSGLAEYAAIEVALELVLRHPTTIDEVLIHTDYQAIVDAARRGSVVPNKYGNCVEIQTRIDGLLARCRDRGISVGFIKVRGHSGIVGNVIADRLAYLARVFRLDSNSVYFDHCTTVLLLHFGGASQEPMSRWDHNNRQLRSLERLLEADRDITRTRVRSMSTSSMFLYGFGAFGNRLRDMLGMCSNAVNELARNTGTYTCCTVI